MEYKIPTKDDLKQIPADEVVDAVVIEITIQTWKERLTADKLSKFKEEDHDKPQVFVKYDCSGIIRDDALNYSEQPTTNSHLGKYMLKYDNFPTVGDKIKVDFDKDSKAKIRL